MKHRQYCYLGFSTLYDPEEIHTRPLHCRKRRKHRCGSRKWKSVCTPYRLDIENIKKILNREHLRATTHYADLKFMPFNDYFFYRKKLLEQTIDTFRLGRYIMLHDVSS